MAALLITDGKLAGRYFPLETHRIVSVGRDDQCTFQVLDEQVSRRHLQVRWDEEAERHLAADYRSANGVFVNGERLDADVLKDGDKIRIGGSTIVYLAEDHADGETAMIAYRKKDEWKRSTILRPETGGA